MKRSRATSALGTRQFLDKSTPALSWKLDRAVRAAERDRANFCETLRGARVGGRRRSGDYGSKAILPRSRRQNVVATTAADRLYY
jgi:hypothetical protein